MRFVRIKSAEQQGQLMQHRTRDLLMRQRTQIINALRAHLAELGMVAAQGRPGVKDCGDRCGRTGLALADRCAGEPDRAGCAAWAGETLIGSIEKRIRAQHRSSEASQRLETIPASGLWGRPRSRRPSRIRGFRSGRDFAAWIGLCRDKIRPAASRNSGRSRNRAIAICDAFWSSVPMRSCGAASNIRRHPWPTQLLARRPFKIVAVALANKMARIAWALLAKGGTYPAPALVAA